MTKNPGNSQVVKNVNHLPLTATGECLNIEISRFIETFKSCMEPDFRPKWAGGDDDFCCDNHACGGVEHPCRLFIENYAEIMTNGSVQIVFRASQCADRVGGHVVLAGHHLRSGKQSLDPAELARFAKSLITREAEK